MTAENRTICEKYKDYIIKKQEEIGDLQTIYRFQNNYGASVIHSIMSYGLELAVLYFEGDTPHFSYSTPITNDVIGYIGDEQELTELLDQIKALKGGQ
mgnify:FL=1